MKNQLDCKSIEAAMPDLLFDPEKVRGGVQAHLLGCARCTGELDSLRKTMQLLDQWEAPEPSPYFMARMGARLREEQARPQRGWTGLISRLTTRIWTSKYNLRPAAGVAALGMLLAIGGGTWLDLAGVHSAPKSTQASNTVRDLQSLNENAQVFQQLSALDSPDTSGQGND